MQREYPHHPRWNEGSLLTDNSFIIFDDADLDLTVDSVITIKFRAAGQTCISAVRDYH